MDPLSRFPSNPKANEGHPADAGGAPPGPSLAPSPPANRAAPPPQGAPASPLDLRAPAQGVERANDTSGAAFARAGGLPAGASGINFNVTPGSPPSAPRTPGALPPPLQRNDPIDGLIEGDAVLRKLPPPLREAAKNILKNADRLAIDGAVGLLKTDPTTQKAVGATLKTLVTMARKGSAPPAPPTPPPNPLPPSTAPTMPSSPGERRISLTVAKW